MMKHSLAACLRIAFPAMLALLSLDTVALAQGRTDRVTTRTVTGPAPRPFDVRFLEGMIDHHAMAVHMSELLRAQAVHPELRAIGDSIAIHQADEIVLMQGWLQQWYGRTHKPSTMMREMRMLEKLKGEAFEREYLRMMIRHHGSAVRQSKDCERLAKHTELHDLCHRIAQSQQLEITTMKDWLCRWYQKCN